MRTDKKNWIRLASILTVLALVVGACGDGGATTSSEPTGTTTGDTEPTGTTTGDTEPTGTTAAAADDIGEPEVELVRVVNSSTDAGSNAPFTIGIEDGTFADEGLTVEVGLVDDPRAPLVGNSADIAVLEVPFMTEAVVEGIDLVIIGGYRCREQYAFVTQPEVTEVADLEGTNVNLNGAPGDPVVDFRLGLLADAGWDLSTVENINYVTIPGSSGAWLEVFTEGQIALTPFFRSQTQSYLDLGGNIIYNEFVEWPNEALVARRDFVEANPNTVARFLRSLMKTTAFFMDPANKDAVIEMSVNQDYGTERLEADYMSGPILHCPNYYINEDVVSAQLEVQTVEGAPSFDEMSVLEPLFAAQASMGMDNEPTEPPSPDTQ
jgi:ABC-type nitrate/sulfonate/bicarbonate transport system substrate-binding protein